MDRIAAKHYVPWLCPSDCRSGFIIILFFSQIDRATVSIPIGVIVCDAALEKELGWTALLLENRRLS